MTLLKVPRHLQPQPVGVPDGHDPEPLLGVVLLELGFTSLNPNFAATRTSGRWRSDRRGVDVDTAWALRHKRRHLPRVVRWRRGSCGVGFTPVPVGPSWVDTVNQDSVIGAKVSARAGAILDRVSRARARGVPARVLLVRGQRRSPYRRRCEVRPLRGSKRIRSETALIAGLLAALMGVAACTPNPPTPPRVRQTSRPPSPTTIDTPAPPGPGISQLSVIRCQNYVDQNPPPEAMGVIFGAVALPTKEGIPALQTAPTGETDPALRLFAKTGLRVRRGATVEIEVPKSARSQLAIGWGGAPSTPAWLVRLTCPPAPGPSGWFSYVGGYWLPKPACLPLIVRVGHQEQVVHIGLGTPCPGQRPPEGPSFT